MANKSTGDTSAPAINRDKEGSDQEPKSTAKSDSQEAGEKVKGEEVQCPTMSIIYDVSIAIVDCCTSYSTIFAS